MIENWNELIKIFGVNDGSLPDVELDGLTGEQVIYGYEYIRNLSDTITSKEPTYWALSKSHEVPISREDNPAKLVVSGEADPFHLCFGGIHSPSGKAIPVLGLFVFSESLAFDYRMGTDWNKEAIEGFFELISGMSKSFISMTITHKNNINDEHGAIFAKYWEQYKACNV